MTEHPVLTQIETLLDEQFVFLQTGRVFDLVSSHRRVEALSRKLAHLSPAPTNTQALKDKLNRNARLLKAAMAGVQTVRHRLAAYSEGAPKLTTYTASGKRTL